MPPTPSTTCAFQVEKCVFRLFSLQPLLRAHMLATLDVVTTATEGIDCLLVLLKVRTMLSIDLLMSWDPRARLKHGTALFLRTLILQIEHGWPLGGLEVR